MIYFCSQCGKPVRQRVPAGDNRLRHVCDACGHIHYENPRLVLGAIVEWQGRVLLCRRAIEPRAGCWTLPAGFMENGESTQAAAARETLEEACAHVEHSRLFALIDVPQIDQVHVFYRGALAGGKHAPGEESLETALFVEEQIPWSQLAFRTVRLALEHYFADRRAGVFGQHQLILEALC
ncbi:ADP-ribose pyrophosphatase [Betaproteobacteria bacterium]|nr:ADP-ribose pyrophosphatase [Betaproteobacteria bacterium]GHU43182.1 ADP-ribose pyrophosphatase [Betaproteobacteria bacterium]